MADEKLTVVEHFRRPESLNPMELVYGVVREPPAPRYGHQSVVTHLGALLDSHVREYGLGEVCVSPVDVVLDEQEALVVQPDIVFVARDRLHIVRDRLWSAPDLVVEVLSRRTKQRDRTTKLGWYRRYGVGECWLVDSRARSVDVVRLQPAPEHRATFAGEPPTTSDVLRHRSMPVREVFG